LDFNWNWFDHPPRDLAPQSLKTCRSADFLWRLLMIARWCASLRGRERPLLAALSSGGRNTLSWKEKMEWMAMRQVRRPKFAQVQIYFSGPRAAENQSHDRWWAAWRVAADKRWII
jgi:hypothetical protein